MTRTQKELVSESHLPGILLASEEECARWIESGVLPVAEHRTVRRRGRLHKVRLFDVADVVAVADLVPSLRTTERRDAGGPGSSGSRGAGESGGGRRERIAEAAGERLGAIVAPAPARRRAPGLDEVPERGRGGAGYRTLLPVELDLAPGPATPVPVEFLLDEPLEVSVVVREARRFSQAEADEAGGILAVAITGRREAAAEACRRAAAAWREELDTYLSAYEGEDRAAILQGIRSGLARLGPIRLGERDDAFAAGSALRAALDELRARATSRRLRHLREAQVREASGYERYAAIFPLARSLGREILFLAGPTNSGKTHEALRLAANAPTAEILSPLRLLALEHYERLREAGLGAGMVTGEERIIPEGATHVARTIETLDLGRAVDVCVIDEVQMLGDPSRGWAWTQAIVGAPARRVVLTGAPEAIPLVEHLVAMTGEPLKVRILKRKGELRVEAAPVDLAKVQPGDAVIAFSRTDIHDLRTRLVRAGRSVATVYGALGPEVRRAEAARFRNREAEVLVATDAIGMGLNIGPLRRVVFSTLAKFDGVRRRSLQPMEIKQIAGRAGRFGHHDVGLVTALAEAGPFRGLKTMIEAALTQESVRLGGKAYVRPNQQTVQSAAEVLRTDRLAQVLQYLDETLVAGHPDLRMADMEETIGLAQLLDTVPLALLDRLAYAIAPVDARDALAVDMLLAWARQHAVRGWVEQPLFGHNADLLKLEARVKIVTTWLWLGQRYPDVYEGPEEVAELRSDLNARIEEKLVSSSTARGRGRTDRDEERGGARSRRRERRRAGRER